MKLKIEIDLEVAADRAAMVQTVADLSAELSQEKITLGSSGKIFAPTGNLAGYWRVTQ